MGDIFNRIMSALAGPMPGVAPPNLGQPSAASALSLPIAQQAWDVRPDGTQKGRGFFGALARPDGGVMSEYSISTDDFGGRDFPTLVPTLTPQEIGLLLNMREGDPVPDSIVEKALAFARERRSHGQPFFARDGEQYDLYPQFQRVPVTK